MFPGLASLMSWDGRKKIHIKSIRNIIVFFSSFDNLLKQISLMRQAVEKQAKSSNQWNVRCKKWIDDCPPF